MSTSTHDGIKKRDDCGLRKHGEGGSAWERHCSDSSFRGFDLRGVRVCGSSCSMA